MLKILKFVNLLIQISKFKGTFNSMQYDESVRNLFVLKIYIFFLAIQEKYSSAQTCAPDFQRTRTPVCSSVT
jgi:hypothetical protein